MLVSILYLFKVFSKEDVTEKAQKYKGLLRVFPISRTNILDG